MLRILLIIAVALAIVIGLQRLTSYRQGAVGPVAPAVPETTAEEQVPASELPPSSESMDVPVTDVMDPNPSAGDDVNLDALPVDLSDQTPGVAAESENETALSDAPEPETPASSESSAESDGAEATEPEAATNAGATEPQ